MSRLLDTLNDKDLALFKIKEAKKNEIIFHEGEKCETVGILKEGLITICSYTFEGKEIVFNTVKPGMMFGNNLLFSNERAYKGDVKAVYDSKIYLINEKSLLSLCAQNISFLKEYLTLSSNAAVNLNERIKTLSFGSLKERLSYMLFLHNGILPYQSLSHLAKELNVERETLSRYLSQQISFGNLKKENNTLTDLTKKRRQ